MTCTGSDFAQFFRALNLGKPDPGSFVRLLDPAMAKFLFINLFKFSLYFFDLASAPWKIFVFDF